MKKISTCLWFDHQGEEAAKFYSSLFKNSKMGQSTCYTESTAEVTGQKVGSPFTTEFEIEGQRIMCLNGGSLFKFTPSLSYFVWCDSEKEIESLWKTLSDGGKNRMALDKYPWAEKYAWTTDKYGVEWQLILKSNPHKIAPAFLFVNKMVGKGEEAVHFYLSLFENSKIDFIHKDPKTGVVMHCMFSLNGQPFVLMEGEGEHGYTFNESFSFVVNCDTQDEIDQYWSKLSEGGEESQCGWLKDQYGVSWQIVPAIMGNLVQDPKRADRVMKAVLQMKKLDLKTLIEK